MRIEFRKSFEKSIKRLKSEEKGGIHQTCQTLVAVIENQQKSFEGLGLKKLDKIYWEIRASLKLRIIFEWQDDLIKFILVGSHDEIKTFLKENV